MGRRGSLTEGRIRNITTSKGIEREVTKRGIASDAHNNDTNTNNAKHLPAKCFL